MEFANSVDLVEVAQNVPVGLLFTYLSYTNSVNLDQMPCTVAVAWVCTIYSYPFL